MFNQASAPTYVSDTFIQIINYQKVSLTQVQMPVIVVWWSIRNYVSDTFIQS